MALLTAERANSWRCGVFEAGGTGRFLLYKKAFFAHSLRMIGRFLLAPTLALVMVAAPTEAFAQSAPAPQMTVDPDPWWGTDKALHLGLSAGITGGSYAIATQITQDVAGRAALAASVGIGLGFAKEVADAMGLGNPSWKDFLWDVIGTSIALSVSISIDLGVRAATGK